MDVKFRYDMKWLARPICSISSGVIFFYVTNAIAVAVNDPIVRRNFSTVENCRIDVMTPTKSFTILEFECASIRPTMITEFLQFQNTFST